MIYILLVIYQLKHFLADYPLQGKFMLGKFLKFPNFILPLLTHGLVHGLFTFAIAIFFKAPIVALCFGLADMAVHCIVDRIKASPSLGGRFKPLTKETYAALMRPEVSESAREAAVQSNTYFWWALGADQLAHHLTHYVIIWALLS